MSGKLIATIYFYLVSASALVLIIIGIFNGVNFIINSTQFEKYPLRYQQGDCGVFGMPYPYKITPETAKFDSSISAGEKQKQVENCEKQQELDRKQHKIEDLKNASTFTLVGLVLFLIHFPLARKQ